MAPGRVATDRVLITVRVTVKIVLPVRATRDTPSRSSKRGETAIPFAVPMRLKWLQKASGTGT
jgi:hypothetical protein